MGRRTSPREAGPPARLGSPVPHDIATEAVVPHEIATNGAVVEVRPADLRSRGDAAREGPPVGVAVLRRDALVRAYRQGYGAASKAEKGRLLDEFVARSGYHRKRAIRLLGHGIAGPRQPPFDDAVRDALVVLWEAAGHVGSRRLKALMPRLVPTLVAEGRLPKNLVMQGKLLVVSAATIDRLIAPARDRRRLEKRIGPVSSALTALAAFRIPSDLPPEERAHLQALHSAVLDKVRRLSQLRDLSAPKAPE